MVKVRRTYEEKKAWIDDIDKQVAGDKTLGDVLKSLPTPVSPQTYYYIKNQVVNHKDRPNKNGDDAGEKAGEEVDESGEEEEVSAEAAERRKAPSKKPAGEVKLKLSERAQAFITEYSTANFIPFDAAAQIIFNYGFDALDRDTNKRKLAMKLFEKRLEELGLEELEVVGP